MTTTAEYNRRSSDNRILNIEEMIAAEDDAKSRAMLIVLNSINLSLVANAHTVREISHKLEAHLESFQVHAESEEALLNKGKGMWKVTAWILGASQALVVSLSISVFNHFAAIDRAITELQIVDAGLSARLPITPVGK